MTGAARTTDGRAPPVVTPDWTAPAHVVAFCTTRVGGISEPPYDTLNLGLHVGDDPARVRENRRRVIERLALPSAPTWLAQVHGTRVVRLGASGIDAAERDGGGANGADCRHGTSGGDAEPLASPDPPDPPASPDPLASPGPLAPPEPLEPLKADGAWSDVPSRVVGVLTADCLPVVVTDEAGSRVAVAHAGWRGLAGGVLAGALAPFDRDAVLHAWLGPAIGPEAFEVGAEVREAFVRRDAAHERAFVARDVPGKYLADLYRLARRELERDRPDGTVHVSGGDRCTLTEADRFHSHRRDGARSGRMATLAWLAPQV